MNTEQAEAEVLRQAEQARKDHERQQQRYPQAMALDQARLLEFMLRSVLPEDVQ
jgi:hypothetical protein